MASLGNLAESGVVALAVSEAAGAVVEPALEPARQEAESAVHARIHNMSELAAAVAQALTTMDDVADEALRNGYDRDHLALDVQLALRAPGVQEALTLYRRRAIDKVDQATAQARLYHAFAKAQIEYQYWPQLLQTADQTLDPAVIALGIVRGLINAPFTLPAGPPTETGKVPAFPVSTIDAEAEAEAAGIDLERLFVMVGNTGRPMPVLEAARATFRHIIDEPDFLRAISEGDIRNEWGPFLLDVAREILTAHDYVELRLRGWITDTEMYAGTALHGMSQADTDLMFKVLGRPMSHHNVFLAQRRGGVYNVTPPDIDPAFLKSLQESNERPEWYGLEWAMRFSQPSVFVIRQYLKDGGDPAWAREKLYFEGWAEADIDIFVKEYAATPTAAGKKLTQAQIHAALKAGTLTPAEALAALVTDGYSPANAQLLLNTWNVQTTTNPAP